MRWIVVAAALAIAPEAAAQTDARGFACRAGLPVFGSERRGEAAMCAPARSHGCDEGYWSAFGAAVRVRRCDGPMRFDAHGPHAERVLIESRSGRVIARDDRVRHQLGRIYPEDPIRTPMLVDEPLAGLSADAMRLDGVDISAFDCPDTGRIVSLFGTATHLCTPTHDARADAHGLFAFSPSASGDATDPLAEVSAYAHATALLGFVATLGAVPLAMRPLRVIAGVRFPATGTDPTGPLRDWNDAAFVPATPANAVADGLGDGHDVIVLGRSAGTDFALDGDVVAHETMHAVIAATAAFGGDLYDAYGTDDAPRALDEAFADYFAAALADHPTLGVYAGGAEGLTGPRHLDGTARAPDDLRGEEHIDSLPFSSALWTARSQLGSSFDRAVYDALTRAAPSATFDAMSAGVVDATERAMGRDAADLARAAFRARGLGVGTVRVVTAAPGLSFVLPAGVEALSYVPGYVQLAIDLAPGDSAVTLSFRADPHALIAGRVFARVGTPVQFHYGGDAGIQADADGSAMLASDGPRFSAHIDVRPTAQASRLFLAIAVDAGERTWATDLAWAVSGIAPLADAGADAGADASVAPSGSGCSARVTPRSDRASVCTLAVLLACLIRRRRP